MGKHSPHRLQTITKGSQSRDSGRDPGELLCGLPHSLLRLLSYNIQDYLPRVALPTWIGLSHTALLMGQSDGGIFSTEIPSSQMTTACVKLKKTHVRACNTHTNQHIAVVPTLMNKNKL